LIKHIACCLTEEKMRVPEEFLLLLEKE